MKKVQDSLKNIETETQTQKVSMMALAHFTLGIAAFELDKVSTYRDIKK